MIPRQWMIAAFFLLLAALGLSIYVWRTGNVARRAERTTADTRAVQPPPAGPKEQATLYVADDASGSVRPQTIQIPLPAGRQQRAEELLRALTSLYLAKNSPHPLGAGSEVRSVYLVDPGLAVIDLNSAFADMHRSGVLVEELTVISFVQTLSANLPGILRVRFLVDGAERDTLAGHADLADDYDVAAVNQLVTQMQPAQP
jgi:Sporulation and spore germination